jgi:UDP-glucose 4-epimerase
MNIIVTGSAGYIAGLFIKTASSDPKIDRIIGIDLLPAPEALHPRENVTWLQADLAIPGWEQRIPADLPIDAIVHCAFKIRTPYGKKKETEKNNLDDCRNVFSFAVARKVPKLIYLSTVSVYSARRENIGKRLTENEPMLETENPYGAQKAETERDLRRILAGGDGVTRAIVLRLNSVTGPVGQSMASKFGLITFLKKILPFVIEAHPAWARQFVHEDDLNEIIHRLTITDLPADYGNPAIFNIAPERFLTARDMGTILHKKIFRLPPALVRPLFFLAWHLSLGRIPTRPDSSAGLIYPINVDGSRIEQAIDFHYAHTAEDALLGKTK